MNKCPAWLRLACKLCHPRLFWRPCGHILVEPTLAAGGGGEVGRGKLMLLRVTLHLLTFAPSQGLLIRQTPAELFYDASPFTLLSCLDFSQPRVRETLPKLLKGRQVPFGYIWPEVRLGPEQARLLVENFIDCSREVQHLVLPFARVFEDPVLRDALRPHLSKYHPDRIEWLDYPNCTNDLAQLLPRLTTNPRLCAIYLLARSVEERRQVFWHLIDPFLHSPRLDPGQKTILLTLSRIILERHVSMLPDDLEPAERFKQSMSRLMLGPLFSEREEATIYALVSQQVVGAASVFGTAGQALWEGMLLQFYASWPHRLFQGPPIFLKLKSYLERYEVDEMPHFIILQALHAFKDSNCGIILNNHNQAAKYQALAEKYPELHSPVGNILSCRLPHWRYVLLRRGSAQTCSFTQRVREAATPMTIEQVAGIWANSIRSLDHTILAGNPFFRPPLQVQFRGVTRTCADLPQLLPLLTEYLWTDRLQGSLTNLAAQPDGNQLSEAFARTLAANALHLGTPLFRLAATDLSWLEEQRMFLNDPVLAFMGHLSLPAFSSEIFQELVTFMLENPTPPSRRSRAIEMLVAPVTRLPDKYIILALFAISVCLLAHVIALSRE